MSLYPPPEIINAEIFSPLPERFRVRGRRCAWADANKQGATLHSFIEGPSFDRDGTLYIVDIPWGRVFKVSPGGDWTLVAEYDGEPNGLKIDREGRILIADYKNGIMRLDPASGAVTPLVERYRVERFKGVNDLFFASNGDLYFTDQGLSGLHDPTGRVFRLGADGRLICLVDTIPSPNGIVLNDQETAVYVAVTRANAVWRLPLLPDGGTTKVGLFIQLSGGLSGPDGMAVDSKGGLYVAHAGNGCVWGFDRMGHPIYRIVVSEGVSTTNVAFGGPERRTLFITESETGTIYKATLPVPGRPLYSHS
jgi:gluconolactonase